MAMCFYCGKTYYTCSNRGCEDWYYECCCE